jgi:hypothetical protein
MTPLAVASCRDTSSPALATMIFPAFVIAPLA